MSILSGLRAIKLNWKNSLGLNSGQNATLLRLLFKK